MSDDTCYIKRSLVREIIIGVSDEHAHITEGILADINNLPIKTPSDFVEQWQPIETVPKDGTVIIVFRPHFDGLYIPKIGVDRWGIFSGRASWANSRDDTAPTLWQPMPMPPERISKPSTPTPGSGG